MKKRRTIEVNKLNFFYNYGDENQNHVLKDIDFYVNEGESVGIMGRAGSGKSTLLYHLNGLLMPCSGSIKVFGIDITASSINLREIRKRIGIVFQNPEDQLFERYLGDDIAFGPLKYGKTIDEAREIVFKVLDMVGIDRSFKDRFITTLSFGQMRLGAIAGVLALEPEVLVLDEPTSGLDPITRRKILDMLKKLNRDGVSIVLVSHRIEDVVDVCRRVYILDDGRVVYTGMIEELCNNPETPAGYGFEPPVASQLADLLRKAGLQLRSGITGVEELLGALEEVLE